MDKEQVKKLSYVAIGIGLPLAIFMIYSLHVIDLIKYSNTTTYCNMTNTAITKASLNAFEYGFNPQNQYHLSTYLNETCLEYQNETQPAFDPLVSVRPDLNSTNS